MRASVNIASYEEINVKDLRMCKNYDHCETLITKICEGNCFYLDGRELKDGRCGSFLEFNQNSIAM